MWRCIREMVFVVSGHFVNKRFSVLGILSYLICIGGHYFLFLGIFRLLKNGLVLIENNNGESSGSIKGNVFHCRSKKNPPKNFLQCMSTLVLKMPS